MKQGIKNIKHTQPYPKSPEAQTWKICTKIQPFIKQPHLFRGVHKHETKDSSELHQQLATRVGTKIFNVIKKDMVGGGFINGV